MLEGAAGRRERGVGWRARVGWSYGVLYEYSAVQLLYLVRCTYLVRPHCTGAVLARAYCTELYSVRPIAVMYRMKELPALVHWLV